jgi:hypothetical protein
MFLWYDISFTPPPKHHTHALFRIRFIENYNDQRYASFAHVLRASAPVCPRADASLPYVLQLQGVRRQKEREREERERKRQRKRAERSGLDLMYSSSSTAGSAAVGCVVLTMQTPYAPEVVYCSHVCVRAY